MELTCLVSLPALTHLSFSPTPTFFCPSVSFPMFSVSVFRSRPVHNSVVPDVQPHRFWWPLILHSSPSSLLLARKGEVGALHLPSKSVFQDFCPFPWDMWAFRFDNL